MFETFLANYEPDPSMSGIGSIELRSGRFDLLVAEAQSLSFDSGLYRLHSAQTSLTAEENIGAAYPGYVGKFEAFGFDWLGRQFAVDVSGRDADATVFMFEIGTGEVLELPGTFESFHNELLPEYRDAALASGFFSEWKALSGIAVLAHDKCVGYRRPLFLGGEDDISNLELSDLDVYWATIGPLRAARLAPGLGGGVDGIEIT